MVKMFLNGTKYFVGDGVELRRLWKKAVKAGFYTAFTDAPKFNPVGTYCVFFEKDEIHWDNFNKHVKEGEKHYNKAMPCYRCFHGVDHGVEDAKFFYESKKKMRLIF